MKLFKTLPAIQSFIGASQGMNLAVLEAHERTALARYIYPSLGKEMFDTLQASYEASPGTAMSADLAALLPYVQSALAKFTMLCWIPEGALNISGSGISVTKTDKLMPASETKIAALKQTYLQGGFADLEMMLEFLESNRSITAYSAWKSSLNYTIFKQYFIPTANEFCDYVKISGRFTFLQLRGAMRSIMDFEIKKTIQPTLFASITTKLKAGTVLSDPENELMQYIKPAFAYLVMAKAMCTLAVVQDERGISLFNATSSATVENFAALDADSREELEDDFEEEGNKYLRVLLDALEAGEYEGYTKTATGALDQYINKPENPNYFL